MLILYSGRACKSSATINLWHASYISFLFAWVVLASDGRRRNRHLGNLHCISLEPQEVCSLMQIHLVTLKGKSADGRFPSACGQLSGLPTCLPRARDRTVSWYHASAVMRTHQPISLRLHVANVSSSPPLKASLPQHPTWFMPFCKYLS